MTNLIVSFFPDRERRVILCSHYDTRPIADQEPDPRKWREPFLSANDGGSGVAFLMELGNQMKDLPTKVGVDFVFFDGEEYIFDPAPPRGRAATSTSSARSISRRAGRNAPRTIGPTTSARCCST